MGIRKVLKASIVLAMGLAMSVTTFAHPGRLDGMGGHRDNKNASGLGSYHYHCGDYPAHLHNNGVCQYKAPSKPSGGTSGTTSGTTVSKPSKYPITQQTFVLSGRTVHLNSILINGVSLGELRTFSDSLGISLEYNSVNKSVIARYAKQYVALVIGSKSAKANGIKTELAVAPLAQDGRTYLPVRYVAESFGMKVHYDSNTRIIYINK